MNKHQRVRSGLAISLLLILHTALFLWVGGGGGMAQTASVWGILTDAETGETVPGANVGLLSQADSSITHYTLASDSGTFEFRNIAPGRYTLVARILGYDTLRGTVQVAVGFTRLDTIRLQYGDGTLEAVEIVGRLDPVTIRGDTLEYNARSFQTNPDATAEDLVRKMPGISSENGQVTAQGEQVQRVLVDGQPVFDNDPLGALRSLPSEMVQSVQVFDGAGDQPGLGSGQTQRTLNIVTRVDRRDALVAKIYGGYGLAQNPGILSEDGAYDFGATLNRIKNRQRWTLTLQGNNVNRQNFGTEDILGGQAPGGSAGSGRGPGGPPSGGAPGGSSAVGGAEGTPGFAPGNASDFRMGQPTGITQTLAGGLNYANQWGGLKLSGSYFFNRNDNLNESASVLTYLQNQQADSGLVYNQSSTARTLGTTHRINLRAEYEIDSANTLLFTMRGNVQASDASTQQQSNTYRGIVPLNTSSSDLAAATNGQRLNGSLLYRYKFSRPGRSLSLNVTGAYNGSQGDQFLTSQSGYFYTDSLGMPIGVEDSLRQQSDRNRLGYSYSGTASYLEPLGKHWQAEIGYSYSQSADRSENLVTDALVGSASQGEVLAGLSTNLHTLTLANQVTGGVAFTHGKHQVVGRVGFVQTEFSSTQLYPLATNTVRTYRNALPSVIYNFKMSASRSFRLIYRTQNTQPTAVQLQDVVDVSDQLRPSSGNPRLRQSYQHFVFLKFSDMKLATSRMLDLNLIGAVTQDYIANTTRILTEQTQVGGETVLQPGAQLTRPENLQGYAFLRAFGMYARPIKVLKCNLGIMGMAGLTRTPSVIDGVQNGAVNASFNIGPMLSSNVGPNLDFMFSSRPGYVTVQNSAFQGSDQTYWNLTNAFRVDWRFGKGFLIQAEASQYLYRGLAFSSSSDYTLLNVSAGRKLFRGQQGEIKFSVYDALNSNRSVQRTVTDTYVQDTRTNVVNRYYMLTFTYTFRRFRGAGAGAEDADPDRPVLPPGMPPPPAGGPPPGFPPPPGN